MEPVLLTADGFAWSDRVPLILMALYGVLSLVTFIAYALDKAAARKGSWRTPESTLHVLSLLGGWPGALVAQRKLRHKTRKSSFRLVFWLTTILNCGILLWFLFPFVRENVKALTEGLF
ncbi:MAG: DUF1294 domain-containing protein [Opitutales bacterium]|nr:DUF1294 domain-containing protein [Opitutales bacterium]